MNLKQLLKSSGISNDVAESVAKAVERQTEKMTEEQEKITQLKAQQLAREWALDMFGKKNPPVPKKKTIIIPDER